MASPQAQLELISETIRLPASGVATFGERGLVFSQARTKADLATVGHALFAARSYMKWALGSLFGEMCALRTSVAGTEKDIAADEAWAREFATAHHLDPKEYREMLGVFLFYRGASDLPGLSFEHYREAMWGADDGQPGGIHRAIGYLRIAHAQGMTVTALRRHIRTSQATEIPEEEQVEIAAYTAVFDFMRFAKRELDNVHDYSSQRAQQILDDLGAGTLSYIDALREIASGTRIGGKVGRKSQRNSLKNRVKAPTT